MAFLVGVKRFELSTSWTPYRNRAIFSLCFQPFLLKIFKNLHDRDFLLIFLTPFALHFDTFVFRPVLSMFFALNHALFYFTSSRAHARIFDNFSLSRFLCLITSPLATVTPKQRSVWATGWSACALKRACATRCQEHTKICAPRAASVRSVLPYRTIPQQRAPPTLRRRHAHFQYFCMTEY